jgi:hypothetical protein
MRQMHHCQMESAMMRLEKEKKEAKVSREVGGCAWTTNDDGCHSGRNYEIWTSRSDHVIHSCQHSRVEAFPRSVHIWDWWFML